MAANPTPITDLRLETGKTPEEATIRCAGRISSTTSGELYRAVRILIPETKSIILGN